MHFERPSSTSAKGPGIPPIPGVRVFPRGVNHAEGGVGGGPLAGMMAASTGRGAWG